MRQRGVCTQAGSVEQDNFVVFCPAGAAAVGHARTVQSTAPGAESHVGR